MERARSCERVVKICNGVVFNARRLGDARICNENVEPISNELADLRRNLRGRLWRGQIRTNGVGFASVVPDVLN
jgi:hypothetical protein